MPSSISRRADEVVVHVAEVLAHVVVHAELPVREPVERVDERRDGAPELEPSRWSLYTRSATFVRSGENSSDSTSSTSFWSPSMAGP